MVKFKPEVSTIVTPVQQRIEKALELVFETFHALPVLVTSKNDGKHKDGSKHYTGEAEDISVRVILEKLNEDLEAELGPDYQVIYEPDKYAVVDGELKQIRKQHFHIEYDPTRER